MGTPKQGSGVSLSLCLPAIGATTPVILQRVDDTIADSDFEAQRDTVQIALGEVLNNVIEHGYASEVLGATAIKLQISKTRLSLEVTDWGQPYPNLALPDGDLPDPLQMAEGGYGWFLIKTLMSDVIYTRRGDANHLTLILMRETV